MARKPREAVIILLDVGSNTLQPSGNDGLTFFDRAKHCAMKLILRKIFSAPDDEVGVILFGSKETKNSLNSDELGFEGIYEVDGLKCATWELLRRLDNIQANKKASVNWIDGLLVALNYARDETAAKKFNNVRIILLSNFLTECDTADIDVITKSINDYELIGVSDTVQYEDTENFTGSHFTQREEKSEAQEKSEKTFADMIKEMENANLCHIDYVESQLIYYQRKAKKAMPWNCPLTIGSDFTIDISAYVHVKEESYFESFKTECVEQNTFTKLTTTYHRNNEQIEKPDEADLIKAYMYGKQICPIDDDMKYDGGQKCLSCLAFCKRSMIPPKFFIGDGCHIVVPQNERKKSPKVFAALVQAMINKSYVMIARKVYRNDTKPHLVVLVPHKEDQGYYLSMTELPYDEEVIHTQFPSLVNEKFKTTTEQASAMDDLIKKMDLMNAVDDESGITEHTITLNPSQQHMCNVVAYRALNPGEPLPPFDEELMKLFDVPQRLKKESESAIDEIEKLFKLEVVRQRVKKPFGQVQKETQMASDDVQMEEESDSLSEKKGITKIGTVTPAEDFLYLVKFGVDKLNTLCDQIQNIIYDFIFRVTTDYSDKAKETILAYREIAVNHCPFNYNKWVREFKEAMVKRNKIDQWNDIFTKEGLGLISASENPISEITFDQQMHFYEVIEKSFTTPTEYGMEEKDELEEMLNDA